MISESLAHVESLRHRYVPRTKAIPNSWMKLRRFSVYPMFYVSIMNIFFRIFWSVSKRQADIQILTNCGLAKDDK
jgi:hypothetical protein